MAGERRTLAWNVVTHDIEHWHPGWLAAAEASDAGGYHDWAVNRLAKAMQEAGEAVIKAHPDLFDDDLFMRAAP